MWNATSITTTLATATALATRTAFALATPYCCLSEACRTKQFTANRPYRCTSDGCAARLERLAVTAAMTDVCNSSCDLRQIGSRYGDGGNGGSYAFPELRRAISDALQEGPTATYCETGFNLGHSSLLALQAFPNITVHAFDIGGPAPAVSAACLRNTFGQRFHLHWGDSKVTVPAEALRCDVILIDGGHDSGVPAKDLANFRRHAAPGARLLMDDVHCKEPHCEEPSAAWDDAVTSGWVSETGTGARSKYGYAVWGYARGRYAQ
eukprot:353154-Prymnesium_polylepis.1